MTLQIFACSQSTVRCQSIDLARASCTSPNRLSTHGIHVRRLSVSVASPAQALSRRQQAELQRWAIGRRRVSPPDWTDAPLESTASLPVLLSRVACACCRAHRAVCGVSIRTCLLRCSRRVD
jgi:hypothetical protein